MIFLGNLFCADEMTASFTPTCVDNINNIELTGGWYDDLMASSDVESELSSEIQQDWNFDTILHAKFEENTAAGNVSWDFDTVSHLLIKRKKDDDFKWITIYVQAVNTIGDFNVNGTDITASAGATYKYAAVPIFMGTEGFYSVDEVEVKSKSLLIADNDEIWNTHLTNNFLDRTSVMPSSVLTTMYGKYPTIVRNTSANYEEITVEAQFFPVGEDGCTYIMDDHNRVLYNKKIKAFLTNGKAKILKSQSGEIWLVYVTTPPTDSATDHYRNRKLSFTVTEIGDPESEEDLYNAGLIPSVSEEWWQK
jgi:hypothetical protein